MHQFYFSIIYVLFIVFKKIFWISFDLSFYFHLFSFIMCNVFLLVNLFIALYLLNLVLGILVIQLHFILVSCQGGIFFPLNNYILFQLYFN